MTEATQGNLIDIKNNTSANQKGKQKNCCAKPNSLTHPISSYVKKNATKPSFNKNFRLDISSNRLGALETSLLPYSIEAIIGPKIFSKPKISVQSTYRKGHEQLT